MGTSEAYTAPTSGAPGLDPTLRLKLSIMMFLEYFIWGAWGVVIFTFIGQLPTRDGLYFPGELQAWIGAALPLGAIISPIFIGLFADRFFSTEKVLAILHLVGAGLLFWAAWGASEHLPKVQKAFDEAARSYPVGNGTLLDALKQEQELQDKVNKASGAEKEAAQGQLAVVQDDVKAGLEVIKARPDVKSTIDNAFTSLFTALILYGICFMPTITLTNSLSFRNLPDPDRYFGSIRVLGTIGWIVAGLTVSLGLTFLGMKEVSVQPLNIAAGASLLLGLFCFALPHTPPTGEAKTLAETLGLPALFMLKDRSFLVFFLCSFVIQLALSFYYQQTNPFLAAMKFDAPTAVQTIGQVIEIGFMFLIPVCLAWFGTKNVLLIGMGAWVLRYICFASLWKPAILGLGLPLHGICFDFFFVVSYLYVDRKAPKNLRASAQGLITFITLGVGWFLGNLIAGWVVALFPEGSGTNWQLVWLVPLAGSAVTAVIFLLLFNDPKADVTEPTAQELAAVEPV